MGISLQEYEARERARKSPANRFFAYWLLIHSYLWRGVGSFILAVDTIYWLIDPATYRDWSVGVLLWGTLFVWGAGTVMGRWASRMIERSTGHKPWRGRGT